LSKGAVKIGCRTSLHTIYYEKVVQPYLSEKVSWSYSHRHLFSKVTRNKGYSSPLQPNSHDVRSKNTENAKNSECLYTVRERIVRKNSCGDESILPFYGKSCEKIIAIGRSRSSLLRVLIAPDSSPDSSYCIYKN